MGVAHRKLAMQHAELLELIDYNPETGELRWRPRRSNRVRAGDAVGWIASTGYRKAVIQGVFTTAQQFIWFYMTGKWPKPKHHIDHINGDRLDNRWCNLREVTCAQNQQNQHNLKADNTSGFAGVYLDKQRCKWRARITVNRKKKHLGFFANIEDAADAYRKAKAELHPFYNPN